MNEQERAMLAEATRKRGATYESESGEFAEQFLTILRESGATPVGAAYRLLYCAGIVAALTPFHAEDAASICLSGYKAAAK